MKHVYVENNIVVGESRVLPTNWNNISNFNSLDQQTLKKYGWFPYRFVKTDVPDGYIVDGSYIEILEDEVVDYQTKRLKTEEEIAGEKTGQWENIRGERNRKLEESDWTQISDSPLSDEMKVEWRVYRQALRDITNYEDPWSVLWPTKPSDESRTSVQPNGEVS